MTDATSSASGSSASGSPPCNLVYVVDDEKTMRASTRQWLELSDCKVRDFAAAEQALQTIDRQFEGVVVSDIKMPGMDGLALQRKIHACDPEIPVILVTGHGDIALAVQAIRNGAYDFIEKPFEPDHLLDAVRRAQEKRRLVLENRALRKDLAAAQDLDSRLIGRSPAMRALKRDLHDYAATGVAVLVHGETGTGKEVIARCLHDFGPTPQGPFIAVNCAAIPTQMAESEFFGHVRGAFTGAEQCRKGKLQAATGGTLFLDELTSTPMEIQGKLLRALEENVIVPLGSNEEIPVSFRLVTAIQERPEDAIAAGTLRKDLYYRVATVTLNAPPLNDRREDAPLLFGIFAAQAGEAYGRDVPALGAEGHAALMAHDWVGNVRELKNTAERFVLSAHPLEDRLAHVLRQADPAPLDGTSLADRTRAYEKHLIEEALARHRGNISAVMADLAVPRRTLNEKMAKYGLTRPS